MSAFPSFLASMLCLSLRRSACEAYHYILNLKALTEAIERDASRYIQGLCEDHRGSKASCVNNLLLPEPRFPVHTQVRGVACRDHKGSGMALILEILSGALVGGAMEDKHGSKNWGCLVAAVDPGLFGDRAAFADRVQLAVSRVKGARKQEGCQEILLPGERGFRQAGKNSSRSMAPVQVSMHCSSAVQDRPGGLRICVAKCSVSWPSESFRIQSLPVLAMTLHLHEASARCRFVLQGNTSLVARSQ